MTRTSHAAPVCDPENRESRPIRFGLGAQPDDREGDDAGQHRHGEQVLDEPDDRPVADDRDREAAAEQVTVGLDDRQQQDDEAPERQRVRHAGHRPLEQLALPDHLGGLGFHVPAGMLSHGGDPLRRGLARPGHPVQPPQPLPGERGGGRRQHKPDDDTQDHADLLMRRLPARGARQAFAGRRRRLVPVAGPAAGPGYAAHRAPQRSPGDAGARRAPAGFPGILPVGNLAGLCWPGVKSLEPLDRLGIGHDGGSLR